jgi:hypothetical protein
MKVVHRKTTGADMVHSIFQFGEARPEYSVRVLNERAVRAGAGIVFFFAIVSFMNAFLLGNYQPTRIFVVCFLLDFGLRIFVNPRFAPSLILGQWMVRKQQPEYVGAPQKRFAWAIGFVLALLMLYLLVLNQVIGPINMLVCSTCLILLFFETAFGICIGCSLYNLLNKEKAQLCPGGACELPPALRSSTSLAQVLILAAFALATMATAQWVSRTEPKANPMHPPLAGATAGPASAAEVERCKVPEFAKAMGHEEKWKLHNHCN